MNPIGRLNAVIVGSTSNDDRSCHRSDATGRLPPWDQQRIDLAGY
jgi:hypothetical protein